MTVWIVGNNLPGCLPDVAPYATQSREEALVALKSDAEDFAEEADNAADEIGEVGSNLAHVEAIFAKTDGGIPDTGPVSFTLTDNDGWGRVFFMAETQEKYYKFPEHELIHTLADALAIWSLNCAEELTRKYESVSTTILAETENVTDEEGLRIIRDILAKHDIHPLHDLGLSLPVEVN